MVCSPTYESCPSLTATEEMIAKREESLDYIVPPPHPLTEMSVHFSDIDRPLGRFPPLDGRILEPTATSSTSHCSPWRQRHRFLGHRESEVGKIERHLANGTGRPTSYSCRSSLSDSPTQLAHTNWKFVEQLLRETKGKTKRMLVEKLGTEAVQLGHGDVNITGVEENTLVASFCDLLERIWAHGLQKKQGKSALWALLIHHQELEKSGGNSAIGNGKPILKPVSSPCSTEEDCLSSFDSKQQTVVSYLQNLQKDLGSESTPWSSSLLRAASFICDKIDRIGVQNSNSNSNNNNNNNTSVCLIRPVPFAHKSGLCKAISFDALAPTLTTNISRHEQLFQAKSPDQVSQRSSSKSHDCETVDSGQTLPPLSTHIGYDLKNVLRMMEIKTDIGYARAFVRLSLERKLLHGHLKTLLSHDELLKHFYKRYAFLRSDDEKEQFLYHILSLTAVDFRCFTNTFAKTKIQYQVLLVTSNTRFVNMSIGVWILLSGSLGQTVTISLPKDTLQFLFDHRNLGVLSTLRLGYEQNDCSSPSKWFLDYILIRNEITGQNYRFTCGRWFGKSVDDGSLERLLVAEMLSETPSSMARKAESGHSRSKTPSRIRSPSAGRSENRTKSKVNEVQHRLGESVNAIVKHFYRNVVKEQSRQLTQLLCADFGLVSTVEQAFLFGFRSSRLFKQLFPWDYIGGQLAKEQRWLVRHGCTLIRKIAANSALGKDGKFQAFIIITIRDHVLSGLLPLMAWTPVTCQLYDEPSFLRTPHYLTFLTQLLNSLNDFEFHLEKSLTYGIES